MFPLIQCHAVDYYHGRFVLVGDAAHSIHPLAGQGINLGLSDAQTLGNEIVGPTNAVLIGVRLRCSVVMSGSARETTWA